MLGDNIKKIMNDKNISSGELSEKAGISPTYVSYIINNKRTPSVELLNKIAEILEIPMEELFKEDAHEGTSTEGFDEKEILTQAAHKVGHRGKLSDDQMDKIKLAIKIVLREDEKNKK